MTRCGPPLGRPGFTAQRYIPSFKHSWERRLFFVGGRFTTGAANRVDPIAYQRGGAEDEARLERAAAALLSFPKGRKEWLTISR